MEADHFTFEGSEIKEIESDGVTLDHKDIAQSGCGFFLKEMKG